jgi:hypothetical protein
MNDTQVAELMRKLDTVTRLVAANMLQGKDPTQQATFLSSIGLETKDIAEILGKDSHLISSTLYQAKQSKVTRKKGAK